MCYYWIIYVSWSLIIVAVFALLQTNSRPDWHNMMTSSNRMIIRVTGPLCGEFTGHPHKGQWRGFFMFSLSCVWINGWVNNRVAGDLRRHRAHCDVIMMKRDNHTQWRTPQAWLSFSAFSPELLPYGWPNCFYTHFDIDVFRFPLNLLDVLILGLCGTSVYMRLFYYDCIALISLQGVKHCCYTCRQLRAIE